MSATIKMQAAMLALLIGLSVYPLQYLSETAINVLPLQFGLYVAVLFYFFRPKLTTKHIALLFIMAFYFLGLIAYNINNPISLITNPAMVTIVTMTLVAITDQGKSRRLPLIQESLAFLFILFIVISACLNIGHLLTQGIAERSKGFGSGTLYATLSVICIVYYTSRYKQAELTTPKYLALCFIPFLSLLLVQSRGNMLVLLLVIGYMNSGSVKEMAKLICLALPLGLLLLSINDAGIGLIERSNPDNFSDLESFSSGRLIAQLEIINWLNNETRPWALVFGNGLNELKLMVARYEIDLPHVDFLYVVYDGGLASVAIYGLLELFFFTKSKVKYFSLIFILSGLHSNMVISPALVVLLHLLGTGHRPQARQGRAKEASSNHLVLPA